VAHVSRKLSNAFEGALAGGGDPATSPLYVFGPFLRLIIVAGVARITFGVSIWMVVLTILVVSAMYRLVMAWIVDGSGGSGLNEEEFGSWAVKVNASITFIEYTLTFLVSMAALVTFIADRAPILNEPFLGIQLRTYIAIVLSVLTGWLVNRGPKVAARAFGPATAGVLLLLWIMIFATIARQGFQLPDFNLQAFLPEYLPFTLGGFVRILAVMTGIEIFANLVAAYEGTPRQKSRKAFGSLVIIMGTTSVTMLIVGPAIFNLADPTNEHVSVFTQTMDILLPTPIAYMGTLVGIAVLGSASAASAQGLQNLALGLNNRNYIPQIIGQRNRFEVADKPVWIEVAIVAICFLFFGTNEETYLAIYAAGVFILLSMTGWAAAKRLVRRLRLRFSYKYSIALFGTLLASILTSVATVIIFTERFLEGAWTYLLFIPVLYAAFSYFRGRLGEPVAVPVKVGLPPAPVPVVARPVARPVGFDRVLVPLDGTTAGELALSIAQAICLADQGKLTLVSVEETGGSPRFLHNLSVDDDLNGDVGERESYLSQVTERLRSMGLEADYEIRSGPVADKIDELARNMDADLVAMSTRGPYGLERILIGNVAQKMVQVSDTPLLMLRPSGEWRSRWSRFKRLLVPLDGSEFSERVLPYTRALARLFDSKILLLSVPDDSEPIDFTGRMQAYLEEQVRQLCEADLDADAIITGSGAARTIVQVSEDERIDLVMLATHGRGGGERLMVGSVADRVLKQASTPVFLVPVHELRQLNGANGAHRKEKPLEASQD
jgi:nucleotide-binding universal stress UspA family protein